MMLYSGAAHDQLQACWFFTVIMVKTPVAPVWLQLQLQITITEER